MRTTRHEDCFKKVRLLWEFVEQRPELYEAALNAGERIKDGDTSGVGELVEFLSTWNRRRGYKNLKQQLTDNLVVIMSEFEREHNEEEFIRKLRNILRDAVKKKTNEMIGAIKLAHVLYPEVFPLIDNPIAKGINLKPTGKTLTPGEYIIFKRALDNIIKDFNLDLPGKEKYKRVDELLYMWYTVKRRKDNNGDNGESLKNVFNGFGFENCTKFFDKFVEALKEKIKMEKRKLGSN